MKKIKKIILVVTIGLILICIASFLLNNNIHSSVSLLDRNLGGKPKDLVYRINLFGVLPIAKAVFKKEEIKELSGKKGIYLNAQTLPLKYCLVLLKGSILLESYLDPITGCPFIFKQKVTMPDNRTINKEVDYDQRNNIMIISGVQRKIMPDTHDPLSVIYNLRHMNLNNVSDFEMSLNTNQKNYVINGKVEKRQLVHNEKVSQLFILKVIVKRRDKNNPYHRSEITILLLNNGFENVPVLIKVFAGGFYFNAKLRAIE